MKRLLVAALAALALAPLAATSAAAAPVNKAGWNPDPAGDHRSFHIEEYPGAPRASVDILRDHAMPHVDNGGPYGVAALAKLADVRTAAQSKTFHQRFSIKVTTTRGQQTFGFTRGLPVRDLATGQVCRGAEGTVNAKTDRVTLYVPSSCWDETARVKAVRVRATLVDPEGMVLSGDMGTRVRA